MATKPPQALDLASSRQLRKGADLQVTRAARTPGNQPTEQPGTASALNPKPLNQKKQCQTSLHRSKL